ncbi:hypothetical protein BGAL_0009g00450 [Botrytis galanthina]|uniref:Uncharacterized protein n=1 Tax=Botrytis galanthina TaxID=278940 RepID=A0A4S8RFM2_9HELO|nr:hypothetical protein BGAL_0009g00450 [Botrytis galanthina]
MGVFNLTDGVQGIVWREPVTFYSCKGVKLDRLANRILKIDVTISDLHVALTFLKNNTGSNAKPEALSTGGLFLYEVYEPLLFQKLKKEYQVVDTLPNNPMFHADQPDPHAAAPKRVEMTLVTRKLIPDEGLQSRTGVLSKGRYEFLENEVEIAFNVITDVKDHLLDFPDLSTD